MRTSIVERWILQAAKTFFFAACMIGLMGILSSCANYHLRSESTDSTAQSPNASAPQITARTYSPRIQIAGRISIFYQQQDKKQAFHGSFYWQQNATHIRVTLLSPLGNTLVHLEWQPGEARLIQSNNAAAIVASDIDALAFQALGWPLPLSNLSDWLQGFVLDSANKMIAVTPLIKDVINTNDGWQLRYMTWQDDQVANSGLKIPKRIDLSRNSSVNPPIEIRLVIDQWQPQ